MLKWKWITNNILEQSSLFLNNTTKIISNLSSPSSFNLVMTLSPYIKRCQGRFSRVVVSESTVCIKFTNTKNTKSDVGGQIRGGIGDSLWVTCILFKEPTNRERDMRLFSRTQVRHSTWSPLRGDLRELDEGICWEMKEIKARSFERESV